MLPVKQATQETLWPPGGWLTKKEAAERLGLSESRVAAMGVIGRLDQEIRPNDIRTSRGRSPDSNQTVTLFNEGDVERVIFNRKNPAEVAKVPARLNKPSFEDLAMGAYVKSIQDASVSARPWITVLEAAEYSGLSASAIEKLIKSKQLAALDCGPRPGGRYRVKRTDLDKLEGTR